MARIRSSDLAPRHLAILRHIGLYRVGLYPVLSRLFFGGQPAGGVLGLLAKDDPKNLRVALVDIATIGTKPRLYKYATLRPAALELAGVDQKGRTGKLGTTALDSAIAIAWFCCCGAFRRHRVEPREVETLWGLSEGDVADLHFFATSDEDFGHPVLLRLYPATAAPRVAVEKLREYVYTAAQHPRIRPWLEAGDFGFGVMVAEPKKVDLFRDAVDKAGLLKDARVVFDVGPTSVTLGPVPGGNQ
jgi:hypothetical protein